MPQFDYIPVAIKVTKDSGLASCSGVILRHNKHCLIISTSACLVGLNTSLDTSLNSGFNSYELDISSLGNVTSDSVTWYPVEIVESLSLSAIDEFMKSVPAYRVVPSSSSGVVLTVMKLKSARDITDFERQFSMVTLVFNEHQADEHQMDQHQAELDLGIKTRIRSCPYSLINPALFMGFETVGSLAYRSGDLLLVDARYLEGMEGGIVLVDDDSHNHNSHKNMKSLGLVCGDLSKWSNNDGGAGGLLVVASWNCIFASLEGLTKAMNMTPKTGPVGLVPNSSIAETSNNSSSADISTVSSPLGLESVVYLIVQTRSRAVTTWGSGVIISSGVIVTNLHVIDNYRMITAYTCTGLELAVQVYSAPLKGLDIVYLRYDVDLYPSSDCRTIPISPETIARGSSVKSLGYGLFYPHKVAVGRKYPLISHGTVSSVLELPLANSRGQDNHLSNLDLDFNLDETAPVMMICSSKCWNGSSGGAVVDDRGLVGIMSSNGRNKATGTQIPELAFVIPINVVMYGLQLAWLGATIQVDNRVLKLWQLGKTHTTIVAKL